MSTLSEGIPQNITYVTSSSPDPNYRPKLWVVEDKNTSMLYCRRQRAARNRRGQTWRNAPTGITVVEINKSNTSPLQSPVIPLAFESKGWQNAITLLIDGQYYYTSTAAFLTDVATIHGIRLNEPLAGEFFWYKHGGGGVELMLKDGHEALQHGVIFT